MSRDRDRFQNPLGGEEENESLPQDEVAGSLGFALPEEQQVLPDPTLVIQALKQILESEFFRTSARGKQFLSYVVQYRLENHPEPLKERMIGAALFNRRLDYATGDDSVVRAQAREVRRRLEKYNTAHLQESPVRIELPTGSYTPEFKLDPQQKDELGKDLPIASLAVQPTVHPLPVVFPGEAPGHPVRKNVSAVFYAVIGLLACAVLVLSFLLYRNSDRMPKGPLAEFWAPATATSKPMLICLPKPIFYRPSVPLYQRSAQRPGEFDHEVDRMNNRPHLRPDDKINWGDMLEYYDYGVSQGDVQAAVRISNFLAHRGKDSELRFGNGYTYEDLRNSPAVVIGAYSNPWTLEMTSGLHFSFADDSQGIRIQEQGNSGRSWRTKHGANGEDYGLVTRLVDSNTGQFVILVAGIEASGSDAAADLIVTPNALEKALHDAPENWPQKNIQIVVSTTVKDTAAGPANIVAVYVW
jgi:hypothetical protein